MDLLEAQTVPVVSKVAVPIHTHKCEGVLSVSHSGNVCTSIL